MAPVSFLVDPLAEDVAPVPATPAREGVGGAMGEEEAGLEFACEAALDCESEFRA